MSLSWSSVVRWSPHSHSETNQTFYIRNRGQLCVQHDPTHYTYQKRQASLLMQVQILPTTGLFSNFQLSQAAKMTFIKTIHDHGLV